MSSERGDRATSFAHQNRTRFWDRIAVLVFLMAYASHCECAFGRNLRGRSGRARNAARRRQVAGAFGRQVQDRLQHQNVMAFRILADASHCECALEVNCAR